MDAQEINRMTQRWEEMKPRVIRPLGSSSFNRILTVRIKGLLACFYSDHR